MRNQDFLFSSESVTEGHPDKVADHISDAILDEIIAHDKNARVACETLVTTGLVVVAGEITTNHHFDVQRVARKYFTATTRTVAFTTQPGAPAAQPGRPGAEQEGGLQ